MVDLGQKKVNDLFTFFYALIFPFFASNLIGVASMLMLSDVLILCFASCILIFSNDLFTFFAHCVSLERPNLDSQYSADL